MQEGQASRTAVLVCQGRAVADGRVAVGRFSDPVATTLLREAERVPVGQVRDGTPPTGWRPRLEFESVRASAQVVVPRTVAIDDALRAHAAPQVVILGAGLDARAWRMPDLSTVEIFEVDHPASQADKRGRVGVLRRVGASVRFVPVDLSKDRLDAALAGAGHRADVATTWIWEGVIPYLRRAEVRATVRAIGALSAPGSRLVANYQSPSLVARAGRLAVRVLGGRSSPTAREPWRSLWTPSQIEALLAPDGWRVVSDEALLPIARRLGSPADESRSLASGRVVVADR